MARRQRVSMLGDDMVLLRVAAWKIAGSALAVVVCSAPGPLRAGHSDADRLACGPSCDVRTGCVNEAALRPACRGGAALPATDGLSARKSRDAPQPPFNAGESKAAQKSVQLSGNHVRRPDAARLAGTTNDSFVRTEANTDVPLLPERGIPIPTVHIGVLPRPDGLRRVGSPGSFEVPGESAADALRRKTLMHICVAC